VLVANVFTKLFLGYQPYQLWANAQYFRDLGPTSQSNWCDKWQVDWWGSDKIHVALNPASQYLLLDLSPVTFSMTSLTSQVVEARSGRMGTANKLAVLQKIKLRMLLLLGHFWMMSQNKTKWEVEGNGQACW